MEKCERQFKNNRTTTTKNNKNMQKWVYDGRKKFFYSLRKAPTGCM